MVTRPRLLLTLFRTCVETVVSCGGLTAAQVFSALVTTAPRFCLWDFFFKRQDVSS